MNYFLKSSKMNLAANFNYQTHTGTHVQLWDFRQRKNVVLFFCNTTNPDRLTAFLKSLSQNQVAYRNENTEVIAILNKKPAEVCGEDTVDLFSFSVLLDTEQKIAARYFSERPLSTNEFGIFVLDRYGEIMSSLRTTMLPSHPEILDTLNLLERQCPE